MDELAAFLRASSLTSIMEAIDEQEEYGLRGTYDQLVEERERRFAIIQAQRF